MRLNLKLLFLYLFFLIMLFGFGNMKTVFAGSCNRDDCLYQGDPNCGWMSWGWCETKLDGSHVSHCSMGCNAGAVTPVPGTNYRTCKVYGSWNCANALICYFPLPTSTPTPQPPLSCQNLFASSLAPALGTAITLTCEKNASYTAAVTYDFMLIKKETKAAADPNPSPTPFVKNSSNILTTYTFPVEGYGYYLFMCRVCAGATCTAWQNPSIPSPTPTNTPIITPTPTPLFSEYFESASIPAGWSLEFSNTGWLGNWGANNGTASIVASPAGLTGSTKSLQIVGHHVSGTDSRTQLCHYSIPGIALNTTYSLAASVYIPAAGTNDWVEILVDGWDTGYTQHEQVIDYHTLPINVSKKGSWQKISGTFKLTQSYVTSVRLCLAVWRNQQALFDEVVIKK